MRKGQLNRHTRYRPATTARNTATLRGRATRWTNTPVRIFKDPAPTPIPAMLHLSAPMPVVVLFFTFSPHRGCCVWSLHRAQPEPDGTPRQQQPEARRSASTRVATTHKLQAAPRPRPPILKRPSAHSAIRGGPARRSCARASPPDRPPYSTACTHGPHIRS